MSIHRWLTASLLLALVASANAQDSKPKDSKPQNSKPQEAKPAKLEWKIEKDKTFYQTVVIESRKPPKPMEKDVKPEGSKPEGGKPDGAKPDGAKPDASKPDATKPDSAKPENVEPDSRQIFYLSWTPLSQEDKRWTLKMKIEGVNLRFTGAGATVAYDSTKDEKPNGVLPLFYSKLVGAELTITLNAEMQATKIEGRTEFLKALEDVNPKLKDMVDRILSEDALKQLTTVTFPALKTSEVKKGDSWDGPTAGLSADFLGSYNVTYKYTDEGAEADANREKIAIKGTVAYSPTSLPLRDQTFKVTKSDWKAHEVSGLIDFRKDKGRVDKLTQTLTLQGTLSIEISGKTSDVDVNLVQTTTVTTSDENPVKKK